jgi:hypothetical protein
MKKLLTLFLVLFVAAIANAAVIELSCDNDMTGVGDDPEYNKSSATIDVYCDTSDYVYDWLLVVPKAEGQDAGSFGDVTILSNAGASSSTEDLGSDDDYAQIIVIHALYNVSGGGHNYAGNHFETTLTLTGSAVQIDLLDDGWNVIDSVTLVPEPMTILLLGIGGLFLRRRK